MKKSENHFVSSNLAGALFGFASMAQVLLPFSAFAAANDCVSPELSLPLPVLSTLAPAMDSVGALATPAESTAANSCPASLENQIDGVPAEGDCVACDQIKSALKAKGELPGNPITSALTGAGKGLKFATLTQAEDNINMLDHLVTSPWEATKSFIAGAGTVLSSLWSETKAISSAALTAATSDAEFTHLYMSNPDSYGAKIAKLTEQVSPAIGAGIQAWDCLPLSKKAEIIASAVAGGGLTILSMIAAGGLIGFSMKTARLGKLGSGAEKFVALVDHAFSEAMHGLKLVTGSRGRLLAKGKEVSADAAKAFAAAEAKGGLVRDGIQVVNNGHETKVFARLGNELREFESHSAEGQSLAKRYRHLDSTLTTETRIAHAQAVEQAERDYKEAAKAAKTARKTYIAANDTARMEKVASVTKEIKALEYGKGGIAVAQDGSVFMREGLVSKNYFRFKDADAAEQVAKIASAEKAAELNLQAVRAGLPANALLDASKASKSLMRAVANAPSTDSMTEAYVTARTAGRMASKSVLREVQETAPLLDQAVASMMPDTHPLVRAKLVRNALTEAQGNQAIAFDAMRPKLVDRARYAKVVDELEGGFGKDSLLDHAELGALLAEQQDLKKALTTLERDGEKIDKAYTQGRLGEIAATLARNESARREAEALVRFGKNNEDLVASGVKTFKNLDEANPPSDALVAGVGRKKAVEHGAVGEGKVSSEVSKKVEQDFDGLAKSCAVPG